MDWASNLFIVLLITDITGTIFFLAGRLFRKRTNNDVAFLRFLTDATVAAFLAPFIYTLLYLMKRINIITIQSDVNLFYGTPLTLRLSAVLGRVWIGLILALLARRLCRLFRWRMVCRGNIPEEDETVRGIFDDLCARFGIAGKVELCRNDSVDMPCITRYHGFVVILPLVDYTEREAEVILCHELCHYLNGDLRLKLIGGLTTLLHVFNPAAHILLRQVDRICEIYCDRTACRAGVGRFTRREYFRVILEALTNDGKKNRYQLFTLVDDRSDYERRIEYMKNYQTKGGLKKGTAVVFAACFLLGSSITALAAGDGVADAYDGVADATSEWADDVENMDAGNISDTTKVMEDEEAVRAIAAAQGIDPASVVVMDEGVVQADDGLWNVYWTVPAGKTYVTSGFREYVGDTVSVVVKGTPDDITFRTGIKDPDAIMHYEEGEDSIGFSFDVKIKGRHYFFVKNMDEERDLDVTAYIAK